MRYFQTNLLLSFSGYPCCLEWSAEQSVEDALQFSLICNQPEEAMKKFIETVINNKDLLRNLFTSQKYEFVEVTVARAFESYLREVLLSRIPDAKMNYNEAETLV